MPPETEDTSADDAQKPREPLSIGYTYRDSVTGFEGTCTGICLCLKGSPRCRLQAVHEGELVTEWFEVERLDRRVSAESTFGTVDLALMGRLSKDGATGFEGVVTQLCLSTGGRLECVLECFSSGHVRTAYLETSRLLGEA